MEQEPDAADICIAASGFTQRSLREVGIAPERIQLLPLAADVDQFQFAERRTDGPLKVLFVGGIGQRKGIKYLLEAVRQLNSAQGRIVTAWTCPRGCSSTGSLFEMASVSGPYRSGRCCEANAAGRCACSTAVFEGFGMVIVEAMATGLPVITSTHSCGPEVIREGVDGFVLAPDDVWGLTEKLAWCAEHRMQLTDMGRAANERAKEFSWDGHRERLRELLFVIC